MQVEPTYACQPPEEREPESSLAIEKPKDTCQLEDGRNREPSLSSSKLPCKITGLPSDHEKHTEQKVQENGTEHTQKGKVSNASKLEGKAPQRQEITGRHSYRDVIKECKPSISTTFAPRPTIRSILQIEQDQNVPLEYMHAEPNEEGYFANPADLEDLGLSMWTNTLVGYFVGRKLPFSAGHKLAHLVWGNRGLEDVVLQANRVYFFRFTTAEPLEDILSQG